MARERVGLDRTILCAVRFWSVSRGPERWSKGPTIHTLLPGVKKVVRMQGYTTEQINKALKKLEKGGFIETKRAGATHASIRLTDKGGRVGCARVKLAPWTNDEYPGAALRGMRRKRS